jgi:hypothetical protein
VTDQPRAQGYVRPIDELVRIDGKTLPIEAGPFSFEEDDWLLYGMLLDPVYMPELLWKDPKNHAYGGQYRVRDYQYIIFRLDDNYAIVSCARSVGKTESEKVHAEIHGLKNYDRLLITAPELIHLLPLTDAVEDHIVDNPLLSELLDVRNGQTGFQHRPFQCIAEGELVLTNRGHVPIEDVVVGDEVLTHRGRWRPVEATWDRGVRDVVEIRASGTAGLRATADHRIYARAIAQRAAVGEHGRRRVHREAKDPEWRAIIDWRCSDPADRACLPATVEPLTVPLPFRMNRSGFGVGRGAEIDPGDPEFLWLLGHYLAEGTTWRGRLTILSIHETEADEIQARLAGLGITSSLGDNVGAGKAVRVTNMALAQFLEREAPGSQRSREIPAWVYGLSTQQRTAVFDGLMYGDGYQQGQAWHGSFASRPLVQSLAVLTHSLGWAFGSGLVEAKQHMLADGHVINAGPQWAFYVNMKPDEGGHRHVWFEHGLAWTAATRIRPAGQARVYDLSVAEDHSFVASGLVVANCNLIDGTKIVGRIPKVTGTGVKAQHEKDLIVEEGQDYPERGWTEVTETVNYDSRDRDGNPDFHYWIYGVHSGNKSSGFDERVRSRVFRKIKVTALRRPDWGPDRKLNAIASYGGTSSPDYKRNILGEPGAGATAYFVTARVMACVDQNITRGEKPGSEYNERLYVCQTFRAEELDDLGMQISDIIDLPDLRTAGWWCGVDIGLTDSPTCISLFAEWTVAKKPRVALMRRFMLERFRPRQIRETLYAIAWHLGTDLMGVGIDVTGLGQPIFQEMEDDELCPPRLRDISAGYVFNSKVEIGVAPDMVTENQGVLRDHLGNMVKVVEDEMTGEQTFVVMLPFIAASTSFIRQEVDAGTLLLPFDTDVTSDMLQETKQRVERVGQRGETGGSAPRKGDRFHILDSFRAAFYRRRQDDIISQLAAPPQVSVFEIADDSPAGLDYSPALLAELLGLGR